MMLSSSVARTASASARTSGPMCSEPPADATTPCSPPASVGCLRDGRLDLVFVGDVGDDRVHTCARRCVTDPGGGGVELVGGSTADRHDRAVARQRERAALTDAAATTGDEHPVSLDRRGHQCSPRRRSHGNFPRMADDVRARAEQMWQEVMRFDAPPITDPYTEATTDQVFGGLLDAARPRSSRPPPDVADGHRDPGLREPLIAHLTAALASGDLSADELHEWVLHLSFYAGWPIGATAYAALREVLRAPTSSG